MSVGGGGASAGGTIAHRNSMSNTMIHASSILHGVLSVVEVGSGASKPGAEPYRPYF